MTMAATANARWPPGTIGVISAHCGHVSLAPKSDRLCVTRRNFSQRPPFQMLVVRLTENCECDAQIDFGDSPPVRGRHLIVIRNNVLYLVIGALVIVVAVLSYELYQDRHQPAGVHIDVGPKGLSIEGK